MNITGIITEYNPLHKGHVYHINEAKKETQCDGIICVMSGNFVQRGAPAILNKWDRTKMALETGVDLVLELPLIYSLSSAEFFSYGAVSLLDSLGIVNNLCFGSESGDIDIIQKIAKVLNEEPFEFKNFLKFFLEKGLSYADARGKALNEFFNDYDDIIEIIKQSNNILAIEYCKSILKLGSCIKPYTIKRIGSSYNNASLVEDFSSATAIRNHLKENGKFNTLTKMLPPSSFKILSRAYKSNNLTFEDYIFKYIKYKALISENTFEKLPDVSEGLHNKIYKALFESNSYMELTEKIKSKRYTHTRISRILCQYFIGFENYNSDALRKTPAQYARILGFTSRGREILKEINKVSSIPIYTKLPKKHNSMLKLDLQGTRAYSLINDSISYDSDFTISPIRLF